MHSTSDGSSKTIESNDDDGFIAAWTNCWSSIEAQREETYANYQAAIAWHAAGYNVVPQKAVDLKHPAVKWGAYQSQRVTLDELQDWHPLFVNGLGFITGDISGIIVIESDGPEGEAILKEFEAKFGALPTTLVIRSGRGLHRHFQHPGGRVTTAANTSIKLDIKGDGGFCVLPPSKHKSGRRYTVEIDAPAAALPVGLIEFIERKAGKPSALLKPSASKNASPSTGSGGQTGTTSSATAGPRPTPEPETPENIARIQSMLNPIDPDVDRETWLRVCWAVLATGWSCAEKLIREWSERGKKFVETDFKKVVTSFDPVRTGGIGVGTLVHIAREHGWQDDPADTQATAEGRRDIANGRRFAEKFRNRLLYLTDSESWLKFDPQTGWQEAPDGEEDRAAKSVVEEIQAEARTKKQNAEVDRTSLLRGLRAMIEMAKSEPGMSAKLSNFDTDPMLIGLQNGIFNLDRWELEPPTPERKVLKRANVVYDPDARCPQFLKFLKKTKKEVRRLLRVWQGYCLTGRTDEHMWIYFDGDGRNGKGTFIELIAWVMGDYASKIPTEMLMSHQRNSQAPSPDIMLLKGLRLAFANETEEGKRLDEARIKDLTGGDTLIGRTPHAKAFISFPPTHKIAISGNYKPEVRDNSTGMWDRVILVSFNLIIPKADRDRRLGDTLKAEGSGILNWLLAALRDYQANGLDVPQEIEDATKAYRKEQDLIGEWLGDNCVSRAEIEATLGAHWLATELVKIAKREGKPEAKLEEGKRSLYFDYAEWAKASGYLPVSQKRLTGQLRKRGYPLAPSQREITGITLRTSRIGQAYNSEIEARATAKAAKAGGSGSGGGQVIGLPVKQPLSAGRRAAPDRGAAGVASVPANSTLEAELAEVAKIVDGGAASRTPDERDVRTGFEELAAPDEALE
jgi:putative DNA primase/helicase